MNKLSVPSFADYLHPATGARMMESSVNGLDEQRVHLNLVLPRVLGSIQLVCSICIFVVALRRRSAMFHRLMLGISLHCSIFAICFIWGVAAVPSDASNIDSGYHGTIATCTAQGTMLYITLYSMVLYYASLSIYSFYGVLHNFDPRRYLWVEKWIHISVHIIPVSIAMYYVSVEAFNNFGLGFCYVANAPLRCLYSEVTCERGPSLQQFKTVLLFGSILLETLYLLFPTVMMMIIFIAVKKKEAKLFITTNAVIQQSIVYLFPLYLMIVLLLSGQVSLIYSKTPSDQPKAWKIIQQTTFPLFTLWNLVTYFYFSFERCNRCCSSSSDFKNSSTNIFQSQEITLQEDPLSSLATTRTTIAKKKEKKSRSKMSFNIFDGTNASGAFAAFIFEADEEDIQADEQETKKWCKVQDL